MNAFDFGQQLQKIAADGWRSWLPGPDAWANQTGGFGRQAAAAARPPRPGVPGNRPSFNGQQQAALDAAVARQRAVVPAVVGNGAAPAQRPGVPGNRPSFNAQQQAALDAANARQQAMLRGAR